MMCRNVCCVAAFDGRETKCFPGRRDHPLLRCHSRRQRQGAHDLKDTSGKIYVEASGNGSTDEQKFHHWLEFVLFTFMKPLLETG